MCFRLNFIRQDDINSSKRRRAIRFIEELKEFDILNFHKVDSLQHNYHLLAAYFNSHEVRDRFIN